MSMLVGTCLSQGKLIYLPCSWFSLCFLCLLMFYLENGARHLRRVRGCSLLRGKVVARNDGMRPSLYQEAATGLIAGAAGAYLSFPFAVGCQHKQVESMGPIAERWRIRSKSVLHILRYGGPWLKRRAGLGMGAGAISAFCAVAWAELAQQASSFSSARQTLNKRTRCILRFN